MVNIWHPQVMTKRSRSGMPATDKTSSPIKDIASMLMHWHGRLIANIWHPRATMEPFRHGRQRQVRHMLPFAAISKRSTPWHGPLMDYISLPVEATRQSKYGKRRAKSLCIHTRNIKTKFRVLPGRAMANGSHRQVKIVEYISGTRQKRQANS